MSEFLKLKIKFPIRNIVLKNYIENTKWVSCTRIKSHSFPWESNQFSMFSVKLNENEQRVSLIQFNSHILLSRALKFQFLTCIKNSNYTKTSLFQKKTWNILIPLVGPPTMITATTLSSELPILKQHKPRSPKPNLVHNSYITKLKFLKNTTGSHFTKSPNVEFIWLVHPEKDNPYPITRNQNNSQYCTTKQISTLYNTCNIAKREWRFY